MSLESPRVSRSSSTSSRGPKLTLDLSDLPPLSQPSPPSNTLIITGLDNPKIFHATSIQEIRNLLDKHASVHTFAPLKSFQRIIVSFYDVESAMTIRESLDRSDLLGSRVRVYFGQDTPIKAADQHLKLPNSDKLFFISPPPSPPHGWEMRNEEPPNKDVHAEDLAEALARLNSKADTSEMLIDSPMSADHDTENSATRRRAGSATLLYCPEDHGCSPDLPAIAVEDITDEEEFSPMDFEKSKFVHTSRPPVELMES